MHLLHVLEEGQNDPPLFGISVYLFYFRSNWAGSRSLFCAGVT